MTLSVFVTALSPPSICWLDGWCGAGDNLGAGLLYQTEYRSELKLNTKSEPSQARLKWCQSNNFARARLLTLEGLSEDISCSQEFPSRSQGPPCACPLRQHIGGLLHKSPGGFAVTSTLQTGVPNPCVVPREVVVSSSSLHPGDPQYRSRLSPGEWRLWYGGSSP